MKGKLTLMMSIILCLLNSFTFLSIAEKEKIFTSKNNPKKTDEVVEPLGLYENPLPEKEPLCRIGLVLEADNKTSMDIVLPPGKFNIWTESQKKTLKCKTDKPLKISVTNTEVICKDTNENEILRSKNVIHIQKADEEETIAPKSGIILKGVVAGRGFHWQKEVDLYFPHKLEFYNWNSKLLVVNEIPMEAYLACVVTSEMSSKCPSEFIKAQATAARSWMVVNLKGKHKGVPYTICNDDCCQRYQGTTFISKEVADSVKQTRGMFLVTGKEEVCSGFYSKCCGGIIEDPKEAFGEKAIGLSDTIDAPENSPTARFNPITEETIREWVIGDWLKETDSFCSPNVCPEKILPEYLGAVDEAGSYYRWKVIYTQEEIVNLLKKKAKLDDITEFLDFKPGKRSNSGRLHQLEIVYRTPKGEEKLFKINSQYQIRNILHEKFLYSSAFIWDFEKDENGKIKKIILQGAGWGHGVGLCQMGALGMALKDYSYEDILKHYYNKTTLKKAY